MSRTRPRHSTVTEDMDTNTPIVSCDCDCERIIGKLNEEFKKISDEIFDEKDKRFRYETYFNTNEMNFNTSLSSVRKDKQIMKIKQQLKDKRFGLNTDECEENKVKNAFKLAKEERNLFEKRVEYFENELKNIQRKQKMGRKGGKKDQNLSLDDEQMAST